MTTSLPDPRLDVDVAIVGAGPAGLAAATAAAGAGCRVAVIDAGTHPGGQFWRGEAHGSHQSRAFAELSRVLDTTRRRHATYLPDTSVWTASATGEVHVLHTVRGEHSGEVTARCVVLACGAYDRQVPVPGWDVPGVFTAGAAQALAKSGVVPGRTMVVGGTGPFLLPVAAGLVRAGVRVEQVVDANDLRAWRRQLSAISRTPQRLPEAVSYLAALARRGTTVRGRHAIVAIHGTARVDAVTIARLGTDWRPLPGTARTITCDAVALDWGFVPNVELALTLGAATRTDRNGLLAVSVDQTHRTTAPGVYAAGEVCGVGGAQLAVVEGRFAGRAAAAEAGRATAADAGWTVGHDPRDTRARLALRAFARAISEVYPVREGWRHWLRPDTVVCRCEEVTAGQIVHAIDELGATDARTAKLLTRAGMGWCQGRMCGSAMSQFTAARTGQIPDLHGLAERPMAAPVPLGVLAGSAETSRSTIGGHDG